MHVPNASLVVVTDGEKMLFFRNEGSALKPSLTIEAKREQDNPPNRDQKSDDAGRGIQGVGNGRSAYEETDFHQLEEDRFAADTAGLLRKRALGNEFESLIVVAPPRMLGALRKHYHKEVERRLVGEISKDLTGHPIGEIEKIIAAQ